MCENAYLSIKNPKASTALKRALDPGRRMLALLARTALLRQQLSASEAGAPPLTKSWIRTCFHTENLLETECMLKAQKHLTSKDLITPVNCDSDLFITTHRLHGFGVIVAIAPREHLHRILSGSLIIVKRTLKIS